MKHASLLVALLAPALFACSSSDEPTESLGGNPSAGSAGAAGAAAGGAGGTTAGAGGAGAAGAAGTGGAGAAGTGGTSAAGTGGAGAAGAGAGGAAGKGGAGAAGTGGAGGGAGSGIGGFGQGGVPACTMTSGCALAWEQAASDKFAAVSADPTALAGFLHDVPKGADLHNHLSGAVYAETYLDWAKTDGNCINSTTFGTVFKSQCSTTNLPVPAPGMFYDDIVRAWSMKDFVAGGAESGHDHFFATFGKFGTIAGAHRDDSIADVAKRAADENLLHVETMFNLGKNIGALTTSIWAGTLTEADLPGLYDQVVAAPTFATELAQDVAVVDDAAKKYRTTLGCSGATPPPACGVSVRFVAQVSRTGAKDLVFGQLISAFEMAAKTDRIVAANLSSPEDDTTSLNNYNLHMAMLDFLHTKYAVTGKSPLHVTLHAGELTPKYLPVGSTANTFHIRAAVEKGHAERIGHGLDVLSETDSAGLIAEMAQKKVMVEVCLSSNTQILEVSGAAHPLAAYVQGGVPVALATDDQGVSRSSMAGEYLRAVQDQQLGYKQLKAMARASLEHAFVPGASLWASLDAGDAVTDCAAAKQVGLGGAPSTACAAFLATSERARLQWELERRFLVFESQQ